MYGYIEKVNIESAVITGWAFNPKTRNKKPLKVSCRINGQIVGKSYVCGTRSDLAVKVSAASNLLFEVKLDQAFTLDDILSHRLIVEIESSKRTHVLPLTPELLARLTSSANLDAIQPAREPENDVSASTRSTKIELAEGQRLDIRTAANTSAIGLAAHGSIRENCWGGSSDVQRIAIDMSGQNVDPAPPASLVRCMSVPLDDPLKAAEIMLPDSWLLNPEPVETPSIWLLKNAHVMGGVITGRTSEGQMGGQLVLANDGSMIPASYAVMDGNKELSIDRLKLEHGHPHLREIAPATYLEGTYFLVGAANNHFGHAILEGLTRIWATNYLHLTLKKDIKFIVYEGYLRRHTEDLLALAGVPLERIIHASPHDIVERLIVPDAAMRTHRSITKLQSGVWETMASQFGSEKPTRMIYLSRRKAKDRRLKNEPEIEKTFAEHGYEIVIPEELSVPEQIRLARESKSLAGCVGSQMYLSCFQLAGSRNVIMAPRNFFLKDDVLITRAKNITLEVVLGSKVNFGSPKHEMEWTVDNGAVRNAINAIQGP